MTQEKPKAWGLARYTVQDGEGEAREIRLMGRDRWAFEMLIRAGSRGITAIEMNGPRLHAYALHSALSDNRQHAHDVARTLALAKLAEVCATAGFPPLADLAREGGAQ
jgi:hypothetical protein